MRDHGLAAVGLICLALALTVLVTVGAPIAASHTTLELKDWLGFAGNILGGLFTLIAAYIAWRAVQPQIVAQRDATMLGLLSREEDRIERMLPGLRDAESFASDFLQYKVTHTFQGIVEALQGEGLSGSNFQKDIEKALPNTDGVTRRRIESKLYQIYRWALHAETSWKGSREAIRETSNPTVWDPSALEQNRAEINRLQDLFRQSREKFGLAMDELENEIRSIRSQREIYEARLVRIRQELENYFGDRMRH